MSEHSELLKDVRELANELIPYQLPGAPEILRTLADVVERQDKVIAELQDVASRQGTEREARIRKREERTAVLENRLDAYLAERSNVIAELAAACVTCDEVITKTIVVYHSPYPLNKVDLARLEAARHLARNAAKLAEPKGDVDEERLAEVKAEMVEHAVAQIESGDDDFVDADKFKAQCDAEQRLRETLADAAAQYDDLLKRLGDGTNEPAEPHSYVAHKLHSTGVPVDAECAEPPGYAEFRERAKAVMEAGSQVSREEALALIDAECAEPPAVEVEMRVKQVTTVWIWECRLGQRWITLPGEEWLAALSAQLGVPLVAVWKEGE